MTSDLWLSGTLIKTLRGEIRDVQPSSKKSHFFCNRPLIAGCFISACVVVASLITDEITDRLTASPLRDFLYYSNFQLHSTPTS